MIWYRPILGYRLSVGRGPVQELLETLYAAFGDEEQPFGPRLIHVDDVGTSNQGCLQRGGDSDACLFFGFSAQHMFIEPDAGAFPIEQLTVADPREKAEFRSLIEALPGEFERWLQDLPRAFAPEEAIVKIAANWRGPTLYLCTET
jgi:hypothetical protein